MIRFLFPILLVCLLVAPNCGRSAESLSEAVLRLSRKGDVTIVITDSGLGGMSVLAQIEDRLKSCHEFRHVRLVFANALPGNNRTYNGMADTKEKAEAFSAALDGFVERFTPDLILIACNTLSVVYPHTEFASRSTVPVTGIVDFGVDLIAGHLRDDTTASAIVVGTPTTTGSDTHRRELVREGFDSARITVQGCDMLESEIQADPNSDIVATMIDMYAEDAAARMPSDTGDVFVALCCTHYGYARRTFHDAFSRALHRDVTILDPNTAMSEALFTESLCGVYDTTVTSVEVVSRAEIGPDDAAAVARMLAPQSTAAAEALTHYTLDTSLFHTND